MKGVAGSRLGFITYALDRAPGGIGRYSRELLRGLRRCGAAPTVLQAGRGRQADGALILPGAGRLPGLMTLGQAEIAWIAWRRGLALVHDPTGVTPLFLSRTVRRVATIHDVIPYTRPQTSTKLDWLIYRFWLPLAVRHLHAVITVSHQSKADIVRHLPVSPERIHVVYEAAADNYRPMSRSEFQPVLERFGLDSPYVLFVGSLETRKNLTRLIEAYAGLRRWSGKWTLVVVGSVKKGGEEVFRTVKRLGLESHVRFLGYVGDEHLPALFCGADLFAFPSLYEGFGLPVLEAMACGTPVLTSNLSSLPEVAGDAAMLVNPLDVEAIAAGMRELLEDPARAAELRTRGLARAKEFSWERAARGAMAVYERALENA